MPQQQPGSYRASVYDDEMSLSMVEETGVSTLTAENHPPMARDSLTKLSLGHCCRSESKPRVGGRLECHFEKSFTGTMSRRNKVIYIIITCMSNLGNQWQPAKSTVHSQVHLAGKRSFPVAPLSNCYELTYLRLSKLLQGLLTTGACHGPRIYNCSKFTLAGHDMVS